MNTSSGKSALNDKRTVLSWALYDWANSAFATTVMAGFFPVFFKLYWSEGVDPAVSTDRLGWANSLGGIVVALLAPGLGAIADKGSSKKKFLLFFAFMGVVMTTSLYMVARGNWLMAFIVYVFAVIGFSGSNIFYDALLTGVSSGRKMDMVSALGYSLGYIGGALLFTLNVWMVLRPETFGFENDQGAIRFSFLTVGLWWAVFSIPLFVFVKEPKKSSTIPGGSGVRAGLAELRDTFRHIRRSKTIFLFLLAYWCYIDGVDTVIRMAVDYGLSIGLESVDLIKALLLTNFIGFPAALGFGWLGSRIGAKQGIFMAIVVYIFISIWGAFMHSKSEFYILAIVVGLVQGGIQALSRSYYARLIPPDKSAEFFGFYNMLGKFAVIIGPVLMGQVGLLARAAGLGGDLPSRISITSVSLLFIAGAVMLYFVDEKKTSRPSGG
ncbi:MAG: MFS transporter [Sedimentisphaerales bacterium]|nr:MFS transporter [Sedimentisphaerales bacterium]